MSVLKKKVQSLTRKEAEKLAYEIPAYSMPLEEVKKKVKAQSENDKDFEKQWQEFLKVREIHSMENGLSSKYDEIVDYAKKTDEPLYLLFPIAIVKQSFKKNNIATMTVKYNYDFLVDKGDWSVFSFGELTKRHPIALATKSGEVLTSNTKFKEVEKEKIVEKTKIIKQEVKGDSKKKVEKIKSKVEHVIENLNEKVKLKILECFN